MNNKTINSPYFNSKVEKPIMSYSSPISLDTNLLDNISDIEEPTNKTFSSSTKKTLKDSIDDIPENTNKEIEHFTNSNAEDIQDFLLRKLERRLKKKKIIQNKISIKRVNSTPETLNFSISIQVFKKKNDGTLESIDQTNFNRKCGRYGLPSNYFGKKVVQEKEKPFTICGIRSENRKYPILLVNDDGKRIKATPQYIKKYIQL